MLLLQDGTVTASMPMNVTLLRLGFFDDGFVLVSQDFPTEYSHMLFTRLFEQKPAFVLLCTQIAG